MKKAMYVLGLFLFCTAHSQVALAKSEIGLNRLGVAAGMVDPEGTGSTVGLEGVADLGTLARDVHISTQVGYWSKSEEDFGVESSIRDISFGSRVTYFFHVSSPKFQPYAGGGLGLHFFHAEVTIPEQDLGGGFIIPGYTASDSETKLGLDLGGGASTPLSATTNLYGEFWYTAADIDQVSLKLGVSFLLSH